MIYRLEPEIGQWQEQGDQQLADRLQGDSRAKRGKEKKDQKIREEQEKMDQLAATMAQLAQA